VVEIRERRTFRGAWHIIELQDGTREVRIIYYATQPNDSRLLVYRCAPGGRAFLGEIARFPNDALLSAIECAYRMLADWPANIEP